MKKFNKKIFVSVITIILVNVFLTRKTDVFGQNAISLSISPPLFEVIIKPGKEVKQVYTISNNGGDTVVTPKIVYFETADENGNITLTENEAPNWVRYNSEPFILKFQDEKQFNVVITPPEGTEETDHFLTLVFETSVPTDVLSENSTFLTSEIGTNILITVSIDGNPKKSAEILEFYAPSIIDSSFPIKYDIVLGNNGNSFWKPNGKIILNDGETLKLASLNVLSGGKRKISCIENETLIDCQFKDKFLFGKQTTILEFTIDEEEKIYKTKIETFAFPFLYTGITLIVLTLLKVKGIFNIWKRKR